MEEIERERSADITSGLRPKNPIRYPLDPNDPLPCHGKWSLFDADEVTPEHTALCAQCPVAAYRWCFEWGLTNDEFGIWAGTDRRQRMELKDAQKGAAA